MNRKNILNAHWIGYSEERTSCPVFRKNISLSKTIKKAYLSVTAIGIYKALINDQTVGHYVFAPGCTNYDKRLQYQIYDVTQLLKAGENTIDISVGSGWFRGRISQKWEEVHNTPAGLIASLQIEYMDNSIEYIYTDESWSVGNSNILFDDIYDGEIYDASLSQSSLDQSFHAVVLRPELSKTILVFQEGEEIREHQIIMPSRVFTTPKGETVIDFGQNLTGYVCFEINAMLGDKVAYTHAETLDKYGNIYRKNYRSAKTEIHYTCKNGTQFYKPTFTFMGFRYLVFIEKPHYLTNDVILSCFKAIAVYSNIKQTGFIETGNEKINQLFSNVIWSQRGNFLDIPTDCPQRDERMGWTGDAQVFCKTAALNYDIRLFAKKWCHDLRTGQRSNGSIPDTVPNFWQLPGASTAWGDVICILPWTMYQIYGDVHFLKDNFSAMKKWVDYMTKDSAEPFLWITNPEDLKLWGKHYGDWLALDAKEGSYIGATDPNFIASAFYAYSTQIVISSGHILKQNVEKYEKLYQNIIAAFKKKFENPSTETEKVLALHFHLTDTPEIIARELANDIMKDGYKMRTGFVGTPYLLHALSEYGYYDLAYDLFLREDYPSWLYSVNQGATTIWEHWDGINDQQEFWSKDMNSFNHYAYGSVFDWIYTVAAGIQISPSTIGMHELIIEPHPDRRMEHLSCRLHSLQGEIISNWRFHDNTCRYEISTPVPATVKINNQTIRLNAGEQLVYSVQL